MPAEIVTGRFCSSYFGTYMIAGSRPGISYLVTMGGTQAHCTCPAFKYSKDGSCKHIEYVWKHACLWNEQWSDGTTDPDLFPLEGSINYPIIPKSECPNCGRGTCPVKIAV